jgi:hypothetical protein
MGLAIVFVTAAAILAACMSLPRIGIRSAGTLCPQLGFRVHREGAGLRLSWDVSALGEPRVGLLRIVDGAKTNELVLLQSQVSRADMMYSPAGDQVSFDLEVFGAEGQRVRESVIAILPSRVTVESARLSGRVTNSVELESIPAPPPQPTVRLRVAERTEWTRKRTGSAARFDTTEQGLAKIPSSSAQWRVDWSIQPIQVRDRVCEIAAGKGTPDIAAATEGSYTAADCVLPRLLTHLKQGAPKCIRELVQGDVQMDFLLTIDKVGRVTKVKPVAIAGPSNLLLMHNAENAVRLLRFEPPRRNERAISSQLIVQLRLARSHQT